jgi:hypothetical protein
MELIFLLVVLVLIAGGAWARYTTSKARALRLSRWADAKGWRFSPERDESIEVRFPVFRTLTDGDDRYARNVTEGTWRGRPFTAFDYHYATGSGKSRKSHEFSAVVLTSEVPLKRLEIGREKLIHRVGAFFGFEDINFESAEFSREFRVTAADRRWAYDVLHSRAIELLLRTQRFTIEMAGMWVIAHREGVFDGRLEAPDFEAALTLTSGLLDLLPEYVVQQQRPSSGHS